MLYAQNAERKMMSKQQDAFDPKMTQEEIEIKEAKRILINAGYKIIEPLKMDKDVKDLQELRKYFNSRLWKKYPEKAQYYTQHYKEEMKIIKEFVESREEGSNRERAIRECVIIIDTIFDREEEFNFKNSIANINILRMGWVINTAVSMLNLEREKEKEEARAKRMREIEDQYVVDLRDSSRRMQKILAKMEENNGV